MSLGRLELKRELELENERGSSCGPAPLIVACEHGRDSGLRGWFRLVCKMRARAAGLGSLPN